MTGARLRPGSPYREASQKLDHIPGQVIIRFKSGAIQTAGLGAQSREISLKEATARLPEEVTAPLRYVSDNAGFANARPLFAAPKQAGRGLLGMGRHTEPARSTIAVLASATSSIDSGFVIADVGDRPEALQALRASSAIEYVEPAPARWLLATRRQVADTDAVAQWALKAIRWAEADRPTAARTRIGILDTGIDITHPALKDCIATYDTNGFLKTDLLGHGTHVAGIMVARAVGQVGMRGISNAKLNVWKIFPDTPEPSTNEFYVDTDAYMDALRSVRTSNVGVVNLSIGGTASSKTEAILFKEIIDAGISVVAAMGNEYEDGNPIEFPGAYPGVIAVGAIGPNRIRAKFSNTARHIWLVAPGTGILSTLPMKKSIYRAPEDIEYAAWDGTSMAAPHVAAAVNLLLAEHGQMSPADVRTRLKRSAAKLPAMKGKAFTSSYGYGLLDLAKLLR